MILPRSSADSWSGRENAFDTVMRLTPTRSAIVCSVTLPITPVLSQIRTRREPQPKPNERVPTTRCAVDDPPRPERAPLARLDRGPPGADGSTSAMRVTWRRSTPGVVGARTGASGSALNASPLRCPFTCLSARTMYGSMASSFGLLYRYSNIAVLYRSSSRWVTSSTRFPNWDGRWDGVVASP